MSCWLIIQERISPPAGTVSPTNIHIVKIPLITSSHSFKYVEESIRKGQVADLDAHRAGSSRPRAMGASNIPKRRTKSVYTLEDDQLLYDFLYPFEQQENAPVHGNKIYQLLERRVFPPPFDATYVSSID